MTNEIKKELTKINIGAKINQRHKRPSTQFNQSLEPVAEDSHFSNAYKKSLK